MDWNNALSSYSELHKVDPFHADGHYNLGFIHMELKLFDIATTIFRMQSILILIIIKLITLEVFVLKH